MSNAATNVAHRQSTAAHADDRRQAAPWQLSPRDDSDLRRRLARWAYRVVGLPEAEFADIYQEAWCKLLKAEQQGRPVRNREAALRWAVHNSWLEELRRRRRRPSVALESAPEDSLMASRVADPAERAELLEAARYLFEATAALTKRQRQIVLLADVHGLPPCEIHGWLGISERLYQLEHSRALRAIGARLGELLADDR
jgi:RNA polymerase sigma factor (sigma-70 family)